MSTHSKSWDMMISFNYYHHAQVSLSDGLGETKRLVPQLQVEEAVIKKR